MWLHGDCFFTALAPCLHVWFHHIVALHRVLFGELEWGCGTDVLHIGPEADGVFAGSSLPGLAGLVIGCQIVERDLHGERLTLVGLELTRLGKGLQFAGVIERQTISSHFFTSFA